MAAAAAAVAAAAVAGAGDTKARAAAAVGAVAEGALLWACELAAICGALSATAPSRAFPARDRAAAGGALGTALEMALGTALEA
jgi:hypothetical protein